VEIMARRLLWDVPRGGWQHGLFAASLALTTSSAIAGANRSPGDTALLVGLSLMLAGWYGYWFIRRGVERQHDRAANLPYLIGAAALWAVMTAVDPAMLLVGVVALVPYCLRHPFWGAGGIVALAATWLSYRYINRDLELLTILVCVLGAVVAVAIAGYIGTLDHEGRKRQQLLAELAAAQAELAVTERRAGILAERARLARDIHDTLTQGFTSIAMLLDAARADLPPDGAATARVEQAMRTARENLAESRRLVNALRPPQLDGTHLGDAARELTNRLSEETDIWANTVVTGKATALNPSTEAQLLRVVQEALTNVRRHANATQATVTVSYLDDLVAIDIQDNGAGLPARSTHGVATSGGVGLATMRERVSGLGGTLIVESRPGEGTTVAVSVPLAGQTHEPGMRTDDSAHEVRSPGAQERLGRS
jgi:signal transduction histidine kinase